MNSNIQKIIQSQKNPKDDTVVAGNHLITGLTTQTQEE